MTKDSPIVLVDTNVWLDNYLPDRVGSASAKEFLARAHAGGMQLVYAVHGLKDVYYIIQREMKRLAHMNGNLTEASALAIRASARACIENMRELATAVGADESDAWMACRYLACNDDLEDNFVLAAAKRARADYIITNDETLMRKSTVPTITAEYANELIELGMF